MSSKGLTVIDASAADVNLVEEAVSFINEKLNQGAYKIYQEIGVYLLEKFFDGNVELASSRNPQKSKSYRELCRHEGLVINPARLSIMVRVAAQERFFMSRKQTTENLSYTQKAELVKLPNDDEKIKLVKAFQKKGVSTRRAAELIAEKRKRIRRPRLPNPPNQDDPETEELPFDMKELGLKALLFTPFAPACIFHEEILALIKDTKQFAREWERLDEDTRDKLLTQTEQAIKTSELMMQVYKLLHGGMRKLRGLE